MVSTYIRKFYELPNHDIGVVTAFSTSTNVPLFFSDLNYDLSQLECEVFSILTTVIINDFLLLNMSFILDKNTQNKYTLKFITIIVLESVAWLCEMHSHGIFIYFQYEDSFSDSWKITQL